jgi:dTDP-4-amino-4,6-dideoxygalactose transaminase
MDPAKIEAAITPRTKAILPVHLYGQPADMDPILELARKRGLIVFEDAAQAHGARYKGRGVGTMGLAAGFSFYPGKNLGAYGEAGASITNDDDLAKKMRVFRDHGQQRKYLHSMIGWNGRMDGIQGAVLSVKLKYIDAWNEARRSHAATYRDLLGDTDGIVLPKEAGYARHVYHVFSVRTDDRDGLLKHMVDRKIGCAVHYPIPIHMQEAYAHLGLGQGSFPVAEQCSREIISLPMFPELTREQLECVAGEVRGFLGQSGSLPRKACAGA